MSVLADQAGLVESAVGGPPVQVELRGYGVPTDAVGPLTVRRGRSDPGQRFDPAELTGSLYADVLDRLPTVGDELRVVLSEAALRRFGLWDDAAAPLGPDSRRNLATNPRLTSLAGVAAGGFSTKPTLALAASPVTLPGRTGVLPYYVPVPDGTPVLRITWPAVAGNTLPLAQVATVPVTPGETYTVSVDVVVPPPPAAGHAIALVVKGALGYLAEFGPRSPAGGPVGEAWYTLRHTVVAASDVLSVQLWPVDLPGGSTVAGWRNHVTALTVERGPGGDYFDGDSYTGVTSWDGAASDSASVYEPGGPAAKAARHRFVGRVTQATLDPAAQPRPRVKVKATGRSSRLGGLRVGAAPWPQESDGSRAARILAAVVDADPSQAYVVPPAGPYTVLARDVDSQPAGRLFDELADDAGSELVELRDGRLYYADAEDRRAALPDLELTASHIVGRPLWQQELAGLVTDATVAYGPTPAGGKQPEVRVVDTPAVLDPGLGRFDVRLATRLATADHATARATDVVGRRSRPAWRIDSLRLEPLRVAAWTAAQVADLLQLDVNGLLTVTGLPSAAPHTTARVWVEGWTEALTRDGWTWDLDVSDYGLTGPAPRPVDVPDDVTVAGLPPHLSVIGSTGHYFGETEGGRVVDVPADVQVREVPDDVTVNNYTERDL